MCRVLRVYRSGFYAWLKVPSCPRIQRKPKNSRNSHDIYLRTTLKKHSPGRYFNTEIIPGVEPAYIAHQAGGVGLVSREFPVLHPASHHLAEDSPEVFVPGVGEEGSRVGEHPHPWTDGRDRGRLHQMADHAVQMVVEPPGRAVLQLARHALLAGVTAGKALGQGRQAGVFRIVQAVENGLGKRTLGVQAVQEGGQRRDDHRVGDGVPSSVGAVEPEEPGVGIAQGADMELHDPAGLGVEPGDMEKDGGGQFFPGPLFGAPAGKQKRNDSVQFLFRGGGEGRH